MRTMFLATALALVAGPLAAQTGPHWVGILGGYDLQDNGSRHAKDNGILGVAAGSWCTPRWGYDLSILGTQLKGKDNLSGLSADEYHAQLAALFSLRPDPATCTPYLRAGLGGTRVGSPWSLATGNTTRLSYHAGIGVQTALADHFMLGLEAREIRIETRTSYNETLGLVTLGYRWGGKASPQPAPAPAPMPAAAPEPPPPPPPPPPPAPMAEPVPAPAPEVPAPAPIMAPAPVPEAAPAQPVKIVLDEAILHFANGRNELSPEGARAIRRVAASLKKFPGDYTVVVSGHTSSLGSPAFNKALSKRRADAVARILAEEGIPAASIQTVGAGADQPLADNKTREGQARNRRVEIEVKVAGQKPETSKIETAVTE